MQEIKSTAKEKTKAQDMIIKHYALIDIKRATGLTIGEILELIKRT